MVVIEQQVVPRTLNGAHTLDETLGGWYHSRTAIYAAHGCINAGHEVNTHIMTGYNTKIHINFNVIARTATQRGGVERRSWKTAACVTFCTTISCMTGVKL